MAPDRDIDSGIILVASMQPISIPLYRLGPATKKHGQHLRIVLSILSEKKLYAKFSKWEFCFDLVAFLGHVVYRDEIKVDLKKIEAVQNWPRPSTTTEMRSFFGLPGYYSCFVEGFPFNET
uniref:Uncharacterized mitochondrial protein AtMg00860-like n=1 Tax=Nicotiana tabacum TaxID=4097 RepID=A0A1S4CVL4_TOBAC|nr:PREDICTED: uncharacterized mitochondrial protein AtMg00860-like [Nicotiana tabacum]